jgi:hypothetical protein
MAPGRKTGGRAKGTPNKKTIERETKFRAAIVSEIMETLARVELGRQEREAVEQQAQQQQAEQQRATPPPEPDTSSIQEYMSRGHVRPLAKDELGNLVPIVKTVVAAFQHAAFFEDRSGAPGKENFDAARWNRFHMWLRTFVEICGRVAEYESPKYKPIEVTSGQAAVDEAERRGENEVTVVIRGGLPEPDAMVELESEQALLKEMAAIQDRLARVRRGRDRAGPAKPDGG